MYFCVEQKFNDEREMKKLLIFMLIALPSITACGQQPKTEKATQPNTADIKVYEQRMDSLQKEYGKLVEAFCASVVPAA